jgi:hypothetical protein
MNSIDYDPSLSKRQQKTHEVKRKLHHGVNGKLHVLTCRYIGSIPLNLTSRLLANLRVNNIDKCLCILWFNKDGPQTKKTFPCMQSLRPLRSPIIDLKKIVNSLRVPC